MICKNCGTKSSGNYCSHCGMPLEKNMEKEEAEQKKQLQEERFQREEEIRRQEEEKKLQEETEQKQQKEDNKKRKEVQIVKKQAKKSPTDYSKKMGNGKSKPSNRKKTKKKKIKRKGVSGLLPTKVMPVKTVKKTISRALQGVSVLLMLGIGAVLVFAFWKERNTLGALQMMIEERNYPLALFIALMVCIIGFVLLSSIWIFSKRKLVSEERIKSFDSGRGLLPFLLIAILVLLAPELKRVVPETHEVIQGFLLTMEILTEHQKVIGTCAVFGFVACLFRKLMRI